jgi:aminoglycoside phosphotransferase (APT) family kinase protein
VTETGVASEVAVEAWLRNALDCAQVSAELSRQGHALSVVGARLLSHSPGKRAVIAYTTADEEGGGRLIGKVYADPARAARLHDNLAQLSAARAEHVHVPQPVALVETMSLSLQEHAAGATLDRLRATDRVDATRGSARFLRALHGLDLAIERRVNLVSEARKVGEWAQVVAAESTALASKATRLAGRLASRAVDMESTHVVPIHKDFHYQHLLYAKGRLSVIDLDELRRGDPALDVAHFCAYLHLLALRETAGDRGALAAEFLHAYAPQRQLDDRHGFYYAYACLKIAKQLARGKDPAPAPQGEERERQLRLVLDEGLAWTA